MIVYRPTADLDDDLCFVPALDGSDDNDPDPDYVPEPFLVDLDLMVMSGGPDDSEPTYVTVPGIMTGTGPKEWR